MAKYMVNEEGVRALKIMSNAIVSAANQMVADTKNLNAVADEYADTLGPHKASLDEVIEELYEILKASTEPINNIAEILSEIAEDYQEIIDTDLIKNGKNGSQSSGVGGKISSFIGKMFGSSEKASGNKFGDYDVDSYGFVKGDGYDSFIQTWEGYNPENFNTESFETPVTKTVPASMIEGIKVSEHDISHQGDFWSQHEKGGTKESFKEIASHIPQVKKELESGRSLSEIKQDPVLGECASIYFEPANMVQVIEGDGFYEFQSNGRHRTLVARELGYDIPVKVIGTRKRK